MRAAKTLHRTLACWARRTFAALRWKMSFVVATERVAADGRLKVREREKALAMLPEPTLTICPFLQLPSG